MKAQSISRIKEDQYMPQVSVDTVIIGYEEEMVKCLLLKFRGKWMLPGGFIHVQESVDDAALRVLEQRTHLTQPHLQFLKVFGGPERAFDREWEELLKDEDEIKDGQWLRRRFITMAYYALVHKEELNPVAGEFDQDIAWFDFQNLPEMWFDHKEIAQSAREQLKVDIDQRYITHNLLPEHFTMPELHRLHQVILEAELDRSRFQKRMLASGKFERLEERQSESRGRNPYLYRIVR